jgi:hypothetical protein
VFYLRPPQALYPGPLQIRCITSQVLLDVDENFLHTGILASLDEITNSFRKCCNVRITHLDGGYAEHSRGDGLLFLLVGR